MAFDFFFSFSTTPSDLLEFSFNPIEKYYPWLIVKYFFFHLNVNHISLILYT